MPIGYEPNTWATYTTASSTGDIIYPTWVRMNSDGTSSIIWNEWNNNYYTTNDSYFLDSTAPSVTRNYNLYYGNWVESQREYRVEHPFVHVRQSLTDEQIKQERERQERYKREYEERERKRKEAQRAAEELLVANLTKEQREMFQKTKKFHVITEGGNRYEVDTTGRAGNVKLLDDKGKPIESHCIHHSCGTPTPNCDNALAQKLMLETDEKEFRRIANIARIRRSG